MKTNWVPLVAIALVVAILATGVFYGLVASRIHEVEASTPPPAVEQPIVPAGLRAITVHVADSLGVVSLLKPGQRVDVQALYGPSHAVELKTVAQNLAVLDVHTQPEATPGRPALPIVTLLVTPEESDVVALADSAARIRLALRSPSDHLVDARPSIGLTAIMRSSAPPSPATKAPLSHVTPARPSLAQPRESSTAP